ncbi:alanine--tRNA ligase [Oceanotoga teriensis]|jgi:alanyl-tRNA synthetase|uniref:alanine--tRNA ligase n=1 Tax=Oceanotoga teriensis TaxID=515440 RepID=UPI00271327D0|nr:alanine--tRNA ligase [Oceanotoga teriensis]MDO7975936.1 alanine--tRNA ligase [Oceanotoga teriensis]
MEWMSYKDIRENFLSFFESKSHKRLASSPLVPNDPQLMFTVAGMVPFKPIFWGKMEPTYTRITTCQKCIRTNDIDNVGRTARHQTFFEMLGNFSFGDYFKEEAIVWAWEFLTDVLHMPEDKLWPSVYLEDDEAFKIWRDIVGVPEDRIMKFDKSENWWGPVGPTGPCGPSSEIYFDTGYTNNCPDSSNCSPACECGRFVEIWNIVFTEFYADENGTFSPLQRKNIDTGAGLERITAAIQNVYSNFDTDVFSNIIKKIEKVLKVNYGQDDKKDVSIKVIADHARAAAFVISEGILPSNEGRGYVLRRIIRRAIRHGNLLGMKDKFFNDIVDQVILDMGSFYPEIKDKKDFIDKIIDAEETRFLETLDKGIEKLNNIIKDIKTDIISGDIVFELYDTYGFPVDITREIAEDNSLSIDEDGFNMFMNEQKERARSAAGSKEYDSKNEAYKIVGEELLRTNFEGYDKLSSSSKVLYLIDGNSFIDSAFEGNEVDLICSNTPFYAEKGGQISDRGIIRNDSFEAEVLSVKVVYNEVIAHRIRVVKGNVDKNDDVELLVDENFRNDVKRNHSATHLLHSALRQVIGDHIKQAGSYVGPDRLRFDFTHYEGLTDVQISEIERIVNDQILKAMPVITDVKSLEEAKNMNVIALFEEKYGDEVRIVKMGDFSSELCGGTHVSNTGEIGLFKIVSESSVSAGIRRIEAITGIKTLEAFNNYETILKSINNIVDGTVDSVYDKIVSILEDSKNKDKIIKKLESKLATSNLDSFMNSAVDIDGKPLIIGVLEDVDSDVLRNTSDTLLSKVKSGAVILFNKSDKVNFVVKVSKDAIDVFHAGNMARNIAKFLGGGGGGRPDFAQAGGKDPSKVNEVVSNIKKFI